MECHPRGAVAHEPGHEQDRDGPDPSYDRSPTLLLHGPPDVWVGNVCFNDHHLELLDHFFPNGNEAAADAWLGIARAAHPTCQSLSESFDKLLPE